MSAFGALVILVGATPLAMAQTDGPTAGTWGIEGSTGSASLLRFRSAASAWLIGANGFLNRLEVPAFDPVSGQTITRTETLANAQLRLGIRHYGDVHDHVRRFSTLSGVLGYEHASSGNDGWTVGAGAELGAAYFFTPHVSMGGSGELNASYAAVSSSGLENRFALSFAGFRLLGAVYF
jgi:hypothetical protein